MDKVIIALIVVAAAAVAVTLVRGIFTMASGRDVSGVKSNRLMTARVVLQAVAILLVVILFLLYGRGAGG
ncbi:MAG: twin transmembrane helix small protein [Thermaurantiacus tibetensis]|uniref:twin transmembrane helix small protein n=1 Tax=Thermaurantiacus tibetensis TaxID=2759035 RepID=UPI0018903197|nr:twin transmembrane helix small protein [Thermaurantiacus tibetensis]